MPKTSRIAVAVVLAAVLVTTVTGCTLFTSHAKHTTTSNANHESHAVTLATLTSASQLGGLPVLAASARSEKRLNLIGVGGQWAGMDLVIEAFRKQYPQITVNILDPDASSAGQITAAKQATDPTQVPDVFDLSPEVRNANVAMFAPYSVANSSDIPKKDKEAKHRWAVDYLAVLSLGYDSAQLPSPPTSLSDLGAHASLALPGDPTASTESAAATFVAAEDGGNKATDVTAGAALLSKLRSGGHVVTGATAPSASTAAHPLVALQYQFTNVSWAEQDPKWRSVIPSDEAVAVPYAQAINKKAPDPAAARLWEEFLYSPAAQNLLLKAGAYPSTLAAMQQAGTVDQAALSATGALPSNLHLVTAAQLTAASRELQQTWGSRQ